MSRFAMTTKEVVKLAKPSAVTAVAFGLAFTITTTVNTVSVVNYDDRLTAKVSLNESASNNAEPNITITPVTRRPSKLTSLARRLRAQIAPAEWAAMPPRPDRIDDALYGA